MEHSSVTLHKDDAKRFEDLLMEHQRSLPRKPGQIGVSLTYPPMSGPDTNGNVTFARLSDDALRVLKRSGILHKVT